MAVDPRLVARLVRQWVSFDRDDGSDVGGSIGRHPQNGNDRRPLAREPVGST
jgi:hypothetical protein